MMPNTTPRVPMLSPNLMTQAGLLPIMNRPVRFAIGDPNGLTSNSWRVWSEKSGVYIACRDSFTETKVSLHTSGRWRMGFTTEALVKRPSLIAENADRAWEVWDRPTETLPNTTTAFHLYFLTSELAVQPKDRVGKKWKDVIYIEGGPPGKMTVVSLFITEGNLYLKHESEPSFVLASFDIGADRHLKLVAHGDADGFVPDLIAKNVQIARASAEEKRIAVPDSAYAYFLGHRDNGARFLVGARMTR